MSNANETQVGGDHYRQNGEKLQHWDLAVHFQWDPFQYQITKYVMRWKDKYRGNPQKQLEDLKKARSFLDKYIANYEAYLEPPHTLMTWEGNGLNVRPVSPETVIDPAPISPYHRGTAAGPGRAEGTQRPASS